MTYRQLAVAGLALGILLFSVRHIEAQPAKPSCADLSECASRFRDAQILSKAGANERALQIFRAIDRQYDDPKVLYPIAVMLDRLGRFAEAVVAYQRYLDSGAETDPEWATKIQEQLRQAQARVSPLPPPLEIPVQQLPPETPAQKPPQETPPHGVSGIAIIPPVTVEPQAVPVYKRGWFWVVIGGSAAAVAIGVGLGVGLTNRVPSLPDGVNTYNATF